MEVSIIIPTIKRTNQLDKLLSSICRNDLKNVEIIIVDQNTDNRLDSIIEKYKDSIDIRQEKVNFVGASKARNYGAKLAKGDILTFPDDDSQMAEDTIQRVKIELAKNLDIVAICGRIRDEQEEKDILRFKKVKTMLTFWNLYHTVTECNLFIRRGEFIKSGMFDETLGVGTYFGAEEGADLVCRLLYEKKKMLYLPEVFLFHKGQKKQYDKEKSYSYGLGFGAFLKKHLIEYFPSSCLPVLYFGTGKTINTIKRMLIAIFTLHKEGWINEIAKLKGRTKGFIKYNP